jgi:hypothetical protein
MRKLMIAIAVFGSLFTLNEAAAQHHRDHRAYRPHVGYRHVAPPVRHYNNHHHRRASRNWAPYVAGGLALGALGGYYYNNQQQIRCWIEAQDMFNSRGRYLGTQEVKVCN